MRIRMLRHVREGLRNLVRNGWMTFASISAVAITLLILGVSLVIAMNAQQMSNYVTNQLEVSVFMKQSVSDAQAAAVATQVRSMPGVASVQLITKEQGMKMVQHDLQQYRSVLAGLSPTNTVPDQLVVKSVNPRQTLTLAHQLSVLPNVGLVKDGSAFVGKLFRFLDIVRNIGIVFVVALIVTAMFLISNTIKVTIFSRRHEIEIMKLVGATNWFIRWPFLLEAVLIGLAGALVPYLVIVFGYRAAFIHSGGVFAVLSFQLVPTVTLALKLAEILFGIGFLIGVWGGVMSVRKFLRV